MNAFSGLPSATLTTLRDSLVQGIISVTLNQSYSLNGRSLTRANLSELESMLGKVQAAMDEVSGDAPDRSYVSFTGL